MEKWTEEEEQYLRDNYDKMEYKEIADILGKKLTAVMWKKDKLELKKGNRRWTEEEHKFIKENFDKMPYKEIGDKIGRSEAAVNRELQRLELTKSNKYDDIKIGNEYGLWKVIDGPFMKFDGTQNHEWWLCKCSCEKQTEREVRSNSLKTDRSVCCGCIGIEKTKQRETTHGLSNVYPDLLNRFSGMHNRCYNPNDDRYKDYGGRGIGICDEWNRNVVGSKIAFENFVKWALENGYKPELSLERTENETGNYGPTICKWATNKEQQNNKRNNRHVICWEESKTISEWIDDERCIIKIYKVIQDRLYDLGWSPEDAMAKPLNKFVIENSTIDMILELRNEGYSYKSISDITKYNEKTIKKIVDNPDLYRNKKAPEDESPEA